MIARIFALGIGSAVVVIIVGLAVIGLHTVINDGDSEDGD